jgi:hypothetical protein
MKIVNAERFVNFFSQKKILILFLKTSKNDLTKLIKEKEIFSKVQGEYVVRSVYTFTYQTFMIFVMDYMCGGDLGS